jgi:hypothetical protein
MVGPVNIVQSCAATASATSLSLPFSGAPTSSKVGVIPIFRASAVTAAAAAASYQPSAGSSQMINRLSSGFRSAQFTSRFRAPSSRFSSPAIIAACIFQKLR